MTDPYTPSASLVTVRLVVVLESQRSAVGASKQAQTDKHCNPRRTRAVALNGMEGLSDRPMAMQAKFSSRARRIPGRKRGLPCCVTKCGGWGTVRGSGACSWIVAKAGVLRAGVSVLI